MLGCKEGTDGFMVASNSVLPDAAAAAVDRRMGLDECRAACLKNCSCTGYANADIRGGGSGCITWTTELLDVAFVEYGGQDLYVQLAGADIASMSMAINPHNKKRRNAVVATLSILSASLLLCLVAYY